MSAPNFWAVVPAAGIGSRMRASLPKQYLPLLDATVIEYALRPLLEHPLVKGVVVAVAEDDQQFYRLSVAKHPKLRTVLGGIERAASVHAGLVALSAEADEKDWVLVHDAARPCLSQTDLNRLIDALQPGDCGAILAQTVVETVKHSDGSGCIEHTLDRRLVYLAQTPQCFGLHELREGYAHALEHGWLVTDEASVFECMGRRPRLVNGSRRNIKITHPDDLALASFYLQEKVSSCV